MKKTSKKTDTKAIHENRTNQKDDALPTTPEPRKRERGSHRGNDKTDEPTLLAMPEPERKSQGDISDYSEVTAESVERVRGEFLSDWRKSKITIAVNTVRFNMACVNLFPGCQHITISVDKEKRRLFIEPTVEHDDTSFKFAKEPCQNNLYNFRGAFGLIV